MPELVAPQLYCSVGIISFRVSVSKVDIFRGSMALEKGRLFGVLGFRVLREVRFGLSLIHI